MPFYDHECQECGHIWEDFYSMVTDPPDTCPECGTVGKVRRLISDDIAVKVKLNRLEQKEQIKAESKKLKEQAKNDEKFRANIVGEDKYHKDQNTLENLRKDLKNI